MTTDVLIVGSGPAGLLLASELCARGASASVVSQDVRAPWSPTYGVWSEHLPPWAEVAVERKFSTAGVHVGGHEYRFSRPYSRLGTARLQATLIERCAAHGVRLVDDQIEYVEHGARSSTARGREAHEAAVVVDASGDGLLLGTSRPTLFQTAYGVVAEARGAVDELMWMDFSYRHGDGHEPATFLYAMPTTDGHVFLEETSLAREGGLGFDELHDRLRRRLHATGVSLGPVVHVERCRIALDRHVRARGRTLGFGAAAGMVHPASGYLLGRLFAQAAGLAEVLVGALSAGPSAASEAGWGCLWPASRRKRFAMYRWGSRAVSRMGADDTREFFSAFFATAPWERWLDDDLGLPELAREMTRLFAHLPIPVQARLVWGAARPWDLRTQDGT